MIVLLLLVFLPCESFKSDFKMLSPEEIPVLWIGKASKWDQERVVIAAHLTQKERLLS